MQRVARLLRRLQACRPIPKSSSPSLQAIGSSRNHIYNGSATSSHRDRRRQFSSVPAELHTDETRNESSPPPTSGPASDWVRRLPIACTGCGALSQTVDPEAPGYFSWQEVRPPGPKKQTRQEEEEVYQRVVKTGALEDLIKPKHRPQLAEPATDIAPTTPICHRCRYLVYQSKGVGILHPSMESIRQIIEESPHKNNHIYHIVDAADFPMSVIPNLQSSLELPRLRTQNRRSKHVRWIRDRVAEVTFIITRADLLAPNRDEVDRMVPLLREILRTTLGKAGVNVRLGNVRCVSAKRGWWTPMVKEEIWKRGGAGWMVGKANVGKSALYEVIFPKGRNAVEKPNITQMRQEEEKKLLAMAGTIGVEDSGPVAEETTAEERMENRDLTERTPSKEKSDHFQTAESEHASERETQHDMEHGTNQETDATRTIDVVDELATKHEVSIFPQQIDSPSPEYSVSDPAEVVADEDYFVEEDDTLLPAARPETAYPQMPVVSNIAGTTASPIRIPYGNGRGELIDLPGIDRTSLTEHVIPEHHKDLFMKSRVVPEQHVIKPGQSILLGGLVRITLQAPDLHLQAYPFVTILPFVSSTSKAIALQTGVLPDGSRHRDHTRSIATELAKTKMAHAGSFALKWDVTKRAAGPLTDSAAGKMKVANLPFAVYSADIVIEGVGWVELTCQVRKRPHNLPWDSTDPFDQRSDDGQKEPEFPVVDVWSPEGKFVALRPPLQAWSVGGPVKKAKHKRRERPRQSMSMHRRREGGARGQREG